MKKTHPFAVGRMGQQTSNWVLLIDETVVCTSGVAWAEEVPTDGGARTDRFPAKSMVYKHAMLVTCGTIILGKQLAM